MTAKQILVIGPSWVGDMVMAQCLFKILKKQNPTVNIDVLAPNWSHGLLARMPEVRTAIEAPFIHKRFHWALRRQVGVALRKQNYDQAIILPSSWKSALVPYFAKIPKRTGWRGEMRYGLLNDLRVLNKKRYPFMVMRYAALAYEKASEFPDQVPKPKLIIDPQQLHAAKMKFAIQEAKGPILALCPGAEFGSSKRWPAEYFIEVAQQKMKEGYAIWLFGSKNDVAVGNVIAQALHQQCVNFVGATSLTEAIDLMSLVSVVLTNDSGLMHIAAALDKSLVVVYGSTSPAFTPPLSDHPVLLYLEDLACRPCFKRECPLGHHRCMRDIQPKKVLDVL
jgi:heptosyltransferase II